MALSRRRAMASRRACRSPRLASVISRSTTGLSSFAFGSVVTICSCLISAAAMLANIALRCAAVRLSLRPRLRWRIVLSLTLPTCGDPPVSVVILEALGQVLDVLGWPVRHLHPEMKAHLRQHFLDLVERLAAEIRRAKHLCLGLLDQVADVDDVVVLETVGGPYRQLQFVHLLQQCRVELQFRLTLLDDDLAWLLEIDEDLELVL